MVGGMDLSKFESQIRKTGFDFENRVAQQLKGARWNFISNKYYVDDLSDTVREIDFVAYQVSKVQRMLRIARRMDSRDYYSEG